MSEAPTFLEKLRKAREAATPGPWVAAFADGSGIVQHLMSKSLAAADLSEDAELIRLLVNNAEKIERLIEAASASNLDNTQTQRTLRAAIAALNEGAA